MAFSVNEKPNLQLAHVCHCALAHMSQPCFTPLFVLIAGAGCASFLLQELAHRCDNTIQVVYGRIPKA